MLKNKDSEFQDDDHAQGSPEQLDRLLAFEVSPVCSVCCFNLFFIHYSLHTFRVGSVGATLTCVLLPNIVNIVGYCSFPPSFTLTLKITGDSLVDPAAFEVMLGCSCHSQPLKVML